MPIPISVLVQHQTNLVTIPLETTLSEALAIMIKYDFSQLPVIDGKPLGLVTNTSIIRALTTLSATPKYLHVKDVLIKNTPFKGSEDLLSLLDYLLSTSAGLVTNEAGELIGIITDYDTTQYFRQRAEDILLVEDIESTLKSHLLNTYGITNEGQIDLQNAINSLNTPVHDSRKSSDSILKHFSNVKGVQYTQQELDAIIDKHLPLPKNRYFDMLALTEYIHCAHKKWDKLSTTYTISQKLWTKMLYEVRDIRNKLAHFRGEVTEHER
jgi:CBS domain-containing protein